MKEDDVKTCKLTSAHSGHGSNTGGQLARPLAVTQHEE